MGLSWMEIIVLAVSSLVLSCKSIWIFRFFPKCISNIVLQWSGSRQWKYDVFLSFSGETRRGFTHFLYKSLQRRGLKIFRDEELERGRTISSDLLAAIKESRFAVVVLSPKYVSSNGCLEELAKIMECMEVEGTTLTVLPVFYKLKPKSLRNQRGAFAEAFGKHEANYIKDRAKVQTWRSALIKLSGIAGWISTKRYECEIMEKIVELVCSR